MRRYTLQIGDREFVIDVQEQSADRFEVVVGNETYDVTLSGEESLSEASITPAFGPAVSAQAAPAAVARPVARATPEAAAPAAPAPRKLAGGIGSKSGSLNAPMPGVILEVNVSAGDVVERGQVVAILEAMKMNNNIKSPRAGTIAEVCVTAGQSVGHGEPIIRFVEG